MREGLAVIKCLVQTSAIHISLQDSKAFNALLLNRSLMNRKVSLFLYCNNSYYESSLTLSTAKLCLQMHLWFIHPAID